MNAGSYAIVGAGGFIGSRLVEILHLDRRIEVRPVVRRASSLVLSARFGIEGRVADACDEAALVPALAGCDVVVHAIAGDPRTIVRSVAPVYRAAATAGCRRVVYLSSAMVHGQSPGPGVDERTPLRRRHAIAYNAAKVRAEQTLFHLRRAGKVEAVALRPGIVFGPRSAWIGDFADALLAGHAFLVGGGRGICNALYVDNLAHAVELAAESEKADGEAFLIGENEAMTWRDFYRPVVEALGREMSEVATVELEAPRTSLKDRIDALRLSPPVQAALEAMPASLRRIVGGAWKASGALPEPLPPGPRPTLEAALLHRSAYCPAWTKARTLLGYEPVVPITEAFRRTVGWLAFAGYPVRSQARRS